MDVCRGVAVLPIFPREIDRYVIHGKRLRRLNHLEAIYISKAVDKLSPQVVYADASDAVATRFSKDFCRNLTVSARVIAEHHAESNYPVVSAASIIAKVERGLAVRDCGSDLAISDGAIPRIRAPSTSRDGSGEKASYQSSAARAGRPGFE